MSLCQHERAAIARLKLDGALKGTAFMIAPGYALTARHLLVPPPTKIELVFDDRAPNEAVTVESTHSSTDADWALLKIKGTTSRRPLPLRSSWSNDAWVSFGYGRVYVENQGLLEGGPLVGQIAAETHTLQLTCEQLRGRTGDEAKGFSGAPVLSAGFVIGIISNVRADSVTKVVKAGPQAVATATILRQWPAGHPQPPLQRPLLIAALAAALDKAEATKTDLAARLGLTGLVTGLRLAERLLELSYKDVRRALKDLDVGEHVAVKRLVDALWIGSEAGGHLFEALRRKRPVAAIRTEHDFTLRHHVMRAQGHQLGGNVIAWDRAPHLIELDPSSGEGLEVLIERGAMGVYKCRKEHVNARMSDPDNDPAIFAIPELPTDEDVAAVDAMFAETPRLIVYSPDVSPAHLTQHPLTATIIEPFPDPDTETLISERQQKES